MEFLFLFSLRLKLSNGVFKDYLSVTYVFKAQYIVGHQPRNQTENLKGYDPMALTGGHSNMGRS